jgi:hypothetical protein
MTAHKNQHGVGKPVPEGEEFLRYIVGPIRPLIRDMFVDVAKRCLACPDIVVGEVQESIQVHLRQWNETRPEVPREGAGIDLFDKEALEEALVWIRLDPEGAEALAERCYKQEYHRQWGSTPQEWASGLPSTETQDLLLRDLGYSGPPLNRWDARKKIEELEQPRRAMEAMEMEEMKMEDIEQGEIELDEIIRKAREGEMEEGSGPERGVLSSRAIRTSSGESRGSGRRADGSSI